ILRNLTKDKQNNGRWDVINTNDRSLAANFNRLRIIRNVNFGHLAEFKLNDKEYNYYKVELKKIITELCDGQKMQNDYVKAIDSVLLSSYNDRDILIYYKRCTEEIINSRIAQVDLVNKIKEIRTSIEMKLDEINSNMSELKIQNKNLEYNQENIKNVITTSGKNIEDRINTLTQVHTNSQNEYLATVSKINKNIENMTDDKSSIILANYLPKESIKNFIRKEELVHKIEEILSKSNKYVIISGYAGLGKTTLASQYAHQQKAENNKRVRWFNAESEDSVWNDYRKMAIYELRIGKEISEKQIIINLVNSKLELLELNVLFVFDDAKDADDINELIINLPNNVQTIITTKNNYLKDNFASGNESNLDMKPFNKTECCEYITKSDKKRTFNQSQAEELFDLIKTNEKEEVHPFKLSKVITLLQKQSWSIQDYKTEIKEHGEINAEEYLLKELINESSNGWKLLQHCVFLDENFISIDILKEILIEQENNSNKIDIDKEKEPLEELSLVNQIELKNEKESVIGIKLHSIIKDTIEKYMDKENNIEKCIKKVKILEKLINVINNKMPEIDNMPNDDWNKAEIYYRHTHKLINLKLVQEINDIKNLGNLYSKIANYEQYKLCNFKNLIKYHKNKWEILKALYDGDHPDVASSLEKLGYCYNKSGDAETGLEYCEQALKMRRNVYRDSHEGCHEDVARSLNGVGFAYIKLQDEQKALKNFEQALKMYQDLYKDNHPGVAESLNNVNMACNKLGDKENQKSKKNFKRSQEYFERSKEYFERASECSKRGLEICQHLYKGNHPDVAKLLSSVGFSFSKLGHAYIKLNCYKQALDHYQQALKYSEEALKMYQDLYKGNHPDVANLLFSVGFNYKRLGDVEGDVKVECYRQALEMHHQSLKMYQNLYKGDHYDIAKTLEQLGFCYAASGDAQNGTEYCKQAKEMFHVLRLRIPKATKNVP
ncbi:unnamed protein product, partial [Didymodactylos carnosus]